MANLVGTVHIYTAAAIVTLYTVLYSRPYVEWLLIKINQQVLKPANFKPKPLIYPVINSCMFLLFFLLQVLDSW